MARMTDIPRPEAHDIPEGATDFTWDGSRHRFYKRVQAFNMSLLERWDGTRWSVAGTLPWADLNPIT